jgi:hypothetical protein
MVKLFNLFMENKLPSKIPTIRTLEKSKVLEKAEKSHIALDFLGYIKFNSIFAHNIRLLVC